MQYQTTEMKTYIRNISNKIAESSISIQNIINLYVNVNEEIEKVKTGNLRSKNAIDNYTKVKNKSREFMMKKIDNQILSCLKNIRQDEKYRIKIERNIEYSNKKKEWCLEKILNNRLQSLFYNINNELENENKIQRGYKNRMKFLYQTKRARREEALKNRNTGLINWQEK